MGVGILLSTVIFSTPKLIRYQIQNRLPSGTQFNDFNLSLDGVSLSGVSFDKGWINGSVDNITSDFKGENINQEHYPIKRMGDVEK